MIRNYGHAPIEIFFKSFRLISGQIIGIYLELHIY